MYVLSKQVIINTLVIAFVFAVTLFAMIFYQMVLIVDMWMFVQLLECGGWGAKEISLQVRHTSL